MRSARRAATFVLFAIPAAQGAAQDLDEIFIRSIKRNAQGALSIYGISAVPSETASTLVFDGDRGPYEDFEFKASQLGGGFTVSASFPLYLEGFIAYNRYDPTFLLSDGTMDGFLPLKWTTVAATGGIGWDFEITENLILRPMAHVSIGRVQSDLSLAAALITDRLGIDASFIKNGGLTVGGLGASLGIEYNKRWPSDYEVDVTLRHTHVRLKPIAGDRDIAASSDAITTALWSRLRVPTGLTLWDRPVRGVTEFSASWLPGDQGKALNTTWLVQGGLGIEIDFSETWVPIITTTRLVARYTKGEVLDGFSIGLAASF